MFKKSILFTDIHFGLRNNSVHHNDMCMEFLDWMIQKAKSENVETAIFLGDYFHNRSNINVSTLNYGLEALKKLSENFTQVFMIVGNHDMYYKSQRDVYSSKIGTTFHNIKMIDNIHKEGECLFVPFLVEDEWKDLVGSSCKYVFGHFELPGYKLNSLIEMPNLGKESDEMFNKCDYIFSGHFHNRQLKVLTSGTEIHYIGNCFAHNFNDAWDSERGCAILEFGGAPVYYNWEAGPKFRNTKLSTLLKNPNLYLDTRVSIKVDLDVDLDSDEIAFIRELLKQEYQLTDFKTSGSTITDLINSGSDIEVESVDQVVINQINALDTNSLDKLFLIELYENL